MAKQPAKGRKAPEKTENEVIEAKALSESDGVVPSIDAIPAEVHGDVKAGDMPTPQQPVEAEAEPTPVEPAAPPADSRNAGFFPLALGGLLAGVIGFAVATFTAPQPDNTLANQVATQATAIAALEDRVANPPTVDLSGIVSAQDALGATLNELSVRVAALEARPVGTGGSVSVDTSDVQAEMDALRAQIAEMTGAAQTELEEARAAAASIEENAAAAARSAAARAALARVQTALESGAPIGAALGDLEAAIGDSAPAALISLQDGVPTLAGLQDQFPDMARAALATARSEGVAGEESGGIGAFIRNQLDVRSTTPQDGDSADAILSRAEAAVRTGRLSDALAEISALPEVARAEMSDWLGQAEARADAIAAVEMLSTSLSDN
ncbi:COG4223 family protein [Loktanella sp. Alg231-35]|uniref:COG4223 family protein n=1 Tax=Loktanella sp. Alg231-35 TaxID=1922220 RepID=UPI000D55631D|nr:hypothetical protein [Loktanella sp. Alg231-35]